VQPAALRIGPPGHCKHWNKCTSFGRSIPLRRHEVAILRNVVADTSLTGESRDVGFRYGSKSDFLQPDIGGHEVSCEFSTNRSGLGSSKSCASRVPAGESASGSFLLTLAVRMEAPNTNHSGAAYSSVPVAQASRPPPTRAPLTRIASGHSMAINFAKRAGDDAVEASPDQ